MMISAQNLKSDSGYLLPYTLLIFVVLTTILMILISSIYFYRIIEFEKIKKKS